MTGWLVYEKEGLKRNRDYVNLYIQEGSHRNISFSVVLCDDIATTYPLPDFAVVRAMRPDITLALESMGVRTFNNSHVSSICNHKGRTYSYLKENNIPVISSIYSTQDSPAPRPDNYPCIIKPCCGHGGKDVCIIKNDEEYSAARERIYPDDFILQPIASGGAHDMRVYIVGNEIVAAVKRTPRQGELRSNFSLGGEVCKKEPSDEEKELCYKVCSLFDFGLCGIDIMYHEGKAVVNEIEDVVGSRMLYKTHENINIVALYLDYIQKKL